MLKKIRKHKILLCLGLIIATGFYLRSLNSNWDNGYYFHPDERALIMFALPLEKPTSWDKLISPESELNPHFFAYGSFPIYLLKGVSELAKFYDPQLGEYGSIHLVGRFLSALFDTATIALVFLLARRLFSPAVGLFSAFCYSVSVLPIQLSHSYAVDTLLTFFLLLSLYFALELIDKTRIRNAIFVGIFFGTCIAIKISALIFLPVLIFSFLYLLTHIRHARVSFLFLITITCSVLTVFFLQPYSFIDFVEFKKQTLQQTSMSYNPFIFPYTLQYVGKIPYLYELRNISLWGLGLPIAIASLAGIAILTRQVFRMGKVKNILLLGVLLYFWLYILFFGKAAVGFMRYMLPIYPIFAIAAGFVLARIYSFATKKLKKKYIHKKLTLVFLVFILLIYPLSFIQIYLKPNTRIQASDWIVKNIPRGSTLAVEHWDDSLPVYNGQFYYHFSLPLYDPDTDEKWENMDRMLDQSQYIIIASNRLYAPLQRLTDCTRLPSYRCYPRTASYYKKLFSGELGFRKIKEFSSHPIIPFTNIEINDISADENFTSFDHPTIMVFKKD